MEILVVSSSDFNAPIRFRISNKIALISAALALGGADASLRIALSIPSRSTNRDCLTSFIVSSLFRAGMFAADEFLVAARCGGAMYLILDQSLKLFNTVPGPGNPQAGGFPSLMIPALMSDSVHLCQLYGH